jgi:thiol-disulfide isomerase/thioredoxin
MIRLSDFKGKTIFIDFWFTGCSGCMLYYKNYVSKAEEQFENNKDLLFITISIDANKGKWLEGLRSGKYTSSQAINLYTNGQGIAHPLIKKLKIIAYPYSLIVDSEGKLIINDVERLRNGGPDALISTINKAVTKR